MKESLLESLGWKKYIGSETGTHTGDPVSARDIRRYALAIDDLNPIYFDEEAAKKGKWGALTAPMGYVSWAVGVPGSEKAVKDLGEDGLATFIGVPDIPDAWTLGWVRAGEELEFVRPVCVNDRVTVRGKIVDMTEKDGRSGKLIFVTSEFAYSNQNGDLLAKHKVMMIATPRKESENE
jgi:acyl dehydratase